MRQAEDRNHVLDKSDLIDLELLAAKAIRTTRAKGLIGNIMFEVGFKKSFSVQATHFKSYCLSLFYDLWIKGMVATERFLSIGPPKLNDQLGLSSFEDKEGKDLLANIQKSESLNDPFVDPSFMGGVLLKDRSSMSFMSRIKIREIIVQPFNKLLSCVRNVKDGSKIRSLVTIIFGGVNFVDAKGPFTINDPSQIGQFKRVVNNFFVRNYRHISKVMNACTGTLSHNLQLNARLND